MCSSKRVFVLACGFLVACNGGRSGGNRDSGGVFCTTGDCNGDGGNFVDPNADLANQSGDCSEASKLVYVVDENNTLSSFSPMTLMFKDLGTLDCPAQSGATPFSMAVDRSATAWVLYSSGELFKVDTTKSPLQCNATTFMPGQQGFLNFGMGFVANAPMSNDETLFIAGGTGSIGTNSNNLGSIAMPSLAVTKIASISGSPELTGTGDAKLWGFFPDAMNPRVAQIDKASGATSNVFPLQLLAGNPAAWAFAFWGGDFWIFLRRDTDASTIVWHLVSSTQQVGAAIPNTGRTIVGAGVSTCAPIMIQ